jgi:hypothetical protein
MKWSIQTDEWDRTEMFTGSWWESQKERDCSQDLEVDEKII